jgi:CubicO group peptidase (beta-lactamase class C family)
MIRGECDPRFLRVREVFARSFEDRLALGASVAVMVEGRPVVDLWGGFADGQRTRPWERDTLVNVFSTTKGWTAVVALRLAEEGVLALDAPVARYWPEFAQGGKGDIRVRALLNHRAGLPAIREVLPNEALWDWHAMTAALAAEAPWWTPDARHGYHAFTYGWLVGEVIRRASGCSVGQLFRERFAGPLDLDAHIGFGPEHDARVAELRASPRPAHATLFDRIMRDPTSMTARAFANPFSMIVPSTFASRAWRGAELPAANGHATARAIARLYGALANGGALEGVHVLAPELIAHASTEHACGADAVLETSTRFGLGFMLSQPGRPDAMFGPNEGAFGHPGAGGSVGFADPKARVGFGYTVNRMGTSILLDPRASALIDAVYRSL